MKKLELENFGVQEMNTNLVMITNGGMGYDAGGTGLVAGRAKGDGAFYVGFFKGFYNAIFN